MELKDRRVHVIRMVSECDYVKVGTPVTYRAAMDCLMYLYSEADKAGRSAVYDLIWADGEAEGRPASWVLTQEMWNEWYASR